MLRSIPVSSDKSAHSLPDKSNSSQPEADRDLAAALHEVGNGLTVVLGWLEEAQREAGVGAVGDAVRVALDRARRAHRIARRAIGADPSSPGIEPLASVVREAVSGLAPAAGAKRVKIQADVHRDVDGAQIEAGERLLQVLTNLLLNALEVTPAGQVVRVDVATGPEAESISLRIEDAGPGIPTTGRDKLFQRGNTGRVGGAGIGLAHAARIAIEEGGKLGAEAYVEGRGAVFELVWPRSATSSQGGPHTRRVALLEECRIAVVDDDRGVLDLLEMVFSARGATVMSFARHGDFVTAHASEPFDVALLDASPYGTGLEQALLALKTSHPALDVILISGAPDPGVCVGKLGVTWIRKPFEVDEVIDVLRLVRASSRSDT